MSPDLKKIINYKPPVRRAYLFLFFLSLFVTTFFLKDSYRWINNISPDAVRGPVQTEISGKEPFSFEKDGYYYEATPLYGYELTGLVVNRMDYTWFSILKRDSVFPMDICAVWGDNLANGIYKDKNLKFSQNMRFCYFRWWGDIKINTEQISNNHLVADSDEVAKKIAKISGGDQVRISGLLVNIKATNLGKAGKYDPESFTWDSSTSRLDSGAGACETIFVTDVEIVRKGNPVANLIFRFSSYALAFLTVWGLASLIFFTGPEASGSIIKEERVS